MSFPASIPWDEAHPSQRTRVHEQRVSEILNDLLRKKALVEVSANLWARGYTPAVPASWSGTPPATIGAALDRIAVLLVSLHGSGA